MNKGGCTIIRVNNPPPQDSDVQALDIEKRVSRPRLESREPQLWSPYNTAMVLLGILMQDFQKIGVVT